MNVIRWGVSAAVAMLVVAGSSFASNDEVESMKETMANMKQEIASMNATIAAERDAMRASAGGAPESLRSANGKATVKIGGALRLLYKIGGYNYYEAGSTSNERRAEGSWDLYKTEVNFTVDFTPDTMGYIALRPDRGNAAVGSLLDEAYWKWSNIGGTGFGLTAGLHTLEYGMYNTAIDPWDRVMIYESFAEDFSLIYGGASAGNSNLSGLSSHDQDLTKIGATATYDWDQIRIAAGIFGEGSDASGEGDLGVTGSNDMRNFGLQNHYVNMTYDPCWMEGLSFSIGYLGRFDQGQGVPFATETKGEWLTTNAANMNRSAYAQERGTGYTPNFDVGVAYIADCWAVYSELNLGANANFYDSSLAWGYSLGGDYSITEKLSVGASMDIGYVSLGSDYARVNPTWGNNVYSWSYRGSLGAKYDFGNGLYIKGQYFHQGIRTYGTPQGDSSWKDCDMFTIETGYKF